MLNHLLHVALYHLFLSHLLLQPQLVVHLHLLLTTLPTTLFANHCFIECCGYEIIDFLLLLLHQQFPTNIYLSTKAENY